MYSKTGHLAITGTSIWGIAQVGLWAIILGGIALTALSVIPRRYAIEPVRGRGGKYRFRITRNGQSIGDRTAG